MPAATDTITPRLRLGFACAGIAAAMYLVAPRTSPFLVALLTAVLLALAGGWHAALPRTLADVPLWLRAALAFVAWMLISVLWSVNRVEGAGKVAIFVALVSAVFVVWTRCAVLGPQRHREVLRAFVMAFAVASVYLCLEELSGHTIKRTVFSLLPWSRPSARHISMAGDDIAFVEAYISNRNMAALTLALWPILLAVRLSNPAPRARLIMASLFAVAAFTVARSQHESSAVALVAGGVVLAIAAVTPRVAARLLAAGWIAACLLVVPVADLAYRQAGWHTAEWLPRTARQRIILWGYTAAQVPNQPLLGVGIASTKPLDDARRETLTKPPRHVYELRTGPHAHNAYLQVWYELGAIGALLFMGLGLALIRQIVRLEAAVQPWLLATFASGSLIGAFTWGLWQAWFMGAFAFAALLAIIIASYRPKAS